MSYLEKTLKIENEFLSRHACKSADTKGREKNLEPDGLRTEFQRDRDRLIHCKAFRRLKHKTQVFLSPEGDHYRTRLTHTLEVSQIARTVSRALSLNEDLTEAIALGHDLGHTPFGHGGERALRAFTDFHHNEQSLRTVDILEYNGKGMNLTFEVRDGILNHTSSGNPATLEGKVVAWSDRIAYINHDIDDAIRGGVIKADDIPEKYRKVFGQTHGARLSSMIMDMIDYSFDKPFVSPSPAFEEDINGLRDFMFEAVYFSPLAKSEEQKAIDMIKFLYEHFFRNEQSLPAFFREIPGTKEARVCDYISTMSDTYAVKIFEEICIPRRWDKF